MDEGEDESRDPCKWAGLRRRLRDSIARQRVNRIEVAAALGIPLLTLIRVLSANSDGPGIAVTQRAQAFLARREEKPSDDTRVSRPGDSGAHPPSGNGARHRRCTG